MSREVRVRLTTSRVVAGGHSQEFGDVITVDQDEAKSLLAAGQAVPVSGPAVETAVVAPPDVRGRRARE